MLRLKTAILASALLAFAGLFAQDSSMRMLPGTVKNFELPSFDERTGYKEWELFGTQAKYFNDKKIDVENMRLEMFEPSKEGKKKATFKSAFAEVSASEKTAKSPQTLFVSGDGFALQGNDWLWRGAKRDVEMSSNVKVNFEAKREKSAQNMEITSGYAAMSYYGDENKFSFKKNVSVKGDDFEINCDSLDTEAPKKRGGKDELESLKEISASGNVKMRQGDISAQAQVAQFTPSLGNMLLLGAPEVVDLKSKAAVSGNKIEVFKNENLALATSSEDGRLRAKAVIISERDGKQSTTVISANTIKMRNLPDSNVFEFSGNVKVESPDFKASASEFTAIAKKSEKDQKYAISQIKGKGNVIFERDKQWAYADNIEILPNEEKVFLKGSAKLEDVAKAVNLNADTITLFNAENRAVALSNPKLKNSFVSVDISESPDIAGRDMQKRKTKVHAKKLECDWNKDRDATFKFSDRVNVISGDIFANCDKLNVYAKNDKLGSSSVEKIEAFGNVSISQSGSKAEAQEAKIFPNVEVEGDYGKQEHKLIELVVNSEKPDIRPRMTLPELGNIGFAENAKKLVPRKTEIESDKQTYVSGKDFDSYIFEGNVKIAGTDFQGSCDKVEARMRLSKSGKRKITLIILKDNLKLSQGGGENKVSAGRGEILPDDEMIVLSESPAVENKDGSLVRGKRIIYKRGRKSVSVENPQITLPRFN